MIDMFFLVHYLQHQQQQQFVNGSRTDSPDNDSAFSDNLSMLSSESSASSGGTGGSGSGSTSGVSSQPSISSSSSNSSAAQAKGCNSSAGSPLQVKCDTFSLKKR